MKSFFHTHKTKQKNEHTTKPKHTQNQTKRYKNKNKSLLWFSFPNAQIKPTGQKRLTNFIKTKALKNILVKKQTADVRVCVCVCF